MWYRVVVSSVKVVVGQLSLITQDPDEKIYSVFTIITEPNYNNVTKLNNLAMMQLSEAIPLTPGAPVGCITYDEVDTGITTGTIMGWGTTVVS